MYRQNRLPIFTLLLGMIMLVLVACTGNPAGEPAANQLPTDTPQPTEEPTVAPDEPVSSEDPTPAPDADEEEQPDGEVTIEDAVVTSVSVAIMESWPLQATAQVEGELGDGCTELVEPITAEREGDTFYITIQTSRPVDAVCTMILQTFSESIPLDIEGLEAGTYTVNANGVEETFTLEQDNVAQPEEESEGEGAEGELSDEDRAELIRLTLERALIDQEIPDYGLIEDPENIVLSTENIDPELVPELEGVNLEVLTPEEIQQKANEEGDFLHLRFDEITVESADKVIVSLSNSWAVAEDSETGYLSGGGFTIEYTRDGEGWSGEVTTTWIS
jgi:NACalpha-BTF3-like transcription factor